MPEHLAYSTWYWRLSAEFDEMVFDFTIHNDPGDFSTDHGLYFIVSQGAISGSTYYFGLQTDVYDPALGRGRGKGMIFSRWGERDLVDARLACADECWAQESGHEGDFIGVRRAYEWDEGNYQMRLTPDGQDEDGEWYAVWFTDLDVDKTLWVGSLKFPYLDGETVVRPDTYSTLEIYGYRFIRPIDIPEWHVSISPPEGDGVSAGWAQLGYGGCCGQNVSNADVQYLDGLVHLRIGGITKQVGAEIKEGDYLDLETGELWEQ